MKLGVIALTAGQGTRLRPYTERLAKPAIPFLGVPLLSHSLRHLQSLPIEKIVLNTFWRPKDIEFLAGKVRAQVPISLSHDGAEILGSGGGVAKAFQQLPECETILVLNGDEVLLPEDKNFLAKAYARHLEQNNVATLLVMEHPGVGQEFGGAWVNSEHQIQKFSKTAVDGLRGFHYIGYLFLQNRAFSYFSSPVKEENILYDCLMRAIQAGEKAEVFPIQCDWYETGNPLSFVEASQKISQGLRQKKISSRLQELDHFLKSQTLSPGLIGFEGTLIDHAQSKVDLLHASLSFESVLRLQFQLQTKSPESLIWPDLGKKPLRKDELWKSTCFELFLGEKKSSSYIEVNASPSGDWNMYKFDTERKGMQPANGSCLIYTERSDEIFRIRIDIETDIIPSEIGATAVLAWKDQQNKYYALKHSKPQADFHNRSDWAWRL